MLRPQTGNKSRKTRRRIAARFEIRLLISVLTTGIPGSILSLLLLWTNRYSLDHKIEGTVVLLLFWISLSVSVRDKVVNSVRALSNIVLSVKENDFSLRATQSTPGDVLGELAAEINKLASAIESDRRGALEAGSLLHQVISEVEAVIFAVSDDGRIKLVNRAAASFFGKREAQLLNAKAETLGIDGLLHGPLSQMISRSTVGIDKRWFVRRTQFRQQGIPHQLLILSEISEALHATERLAWQRLVRVLSHEINNTLAPIQSIASTFLRLSHRGVLEPDGESFRSGLEVISSRASSLNRFLQSYARLTKLPTIAKRAIQMRELLTKVVNVEQRVAISIAPDEDVVVRVDPDQIEQVLINLCKNAVDAVLSRPGAHLLSSPVVVSWSVSDGNFKLWVRDKGLGLFDTTNLFVPFYTTKKGGTGVGLPLSRQIIEAHGGTLILRNRDNTSGCEAEITIPDCVAQKPEYKVVTSYMDTSCQRVPGPPDKI